MQLNLIDIRPDEASRAALLNEQAYYRQFLNGEALSRAAVDALLPERQDFVVVWKYLRASAVRGVVLEDFGCLCRKIARFAAQPCSFGRTRMCLDVFAELGLLQITQRPKLVRIRLLPGARKADLEKSVILNTLRKQKAGSNYGSESGIV